MTQASHLQMLVQRIHKQRENMQPSIDLRRRFLAAAVQNQLKNEHALIERHVTKLQPALRTVYMRHRRENKKKSLVKK